MRLEGSYKVGAPREAVYQQLMDPNVLARAMPGCEKLEANPDGSYSAALRVGIGRVKGAYKGRIEILDAVPPERFRMKVEGRGSAGFMKGEGALTFAENSGETVINYSGDVDVGGLIASVGQRLILAAARQTANQFFQDFSRQIAAKPSEVPPPAAPQPLE